MSWTRSLLKYPGGKYALLQAIADLVPKEKIDVYVEPFVGGASVAINIGRMYPMMLLNDGNSDVIDFWDSIRSKTPQFLKWVDKYAECRGPDHYKNFRLQFNDKNSNISQAQRAALFYYLNREGFNGLIRYNAKGEFNVPYGKYKTFKKPDPDHVYKLGSLLSGNVGLFKQGWQDFLLYKVYPLLDKKARVFVYLDPPYLPISKTSSFTSYWKPFGVDQHEALAAHLKALNSAGAHFVLSNSKCAETERIFKTFNFFEVKAPRNISCKGTGRGAIGEYLITNYDPNSL